jgi:sugar phosphate isomerase/epimerase/predicted enzyme related to lactoylglutathione lyase
MNLLLTLPALAAIVLGLGAPADPPRPRLTGIAHVAFYVNDFDKARAFYRDLLGYTEVSPMKNADGSLRLTYFKVNDRQFVELLPERAGGSDRLAHIALATEDVEGMRAYLKARGVAVPDKVTLGTVGNTNFSVKDPDGHAIEFVSYSADSPLSPRPRGVRLQPDEQRQPDVKPPLSSIMRHAGILVGALDPAMAFYRDILGFREIWRGSADSKTLSWVNVQLPDGDDYLEFMLYSTLPPENARGSQHHICLVVPDMSAAAAAVQARAAVAGYSRPIEPRTGINRKRQLNLYDADGTRSELMEPGTIDGKPAPSSTAPPPAAGPARGVSIGVCLDAAQLEAAQAAGFDYVEINASKVAALPDEEFQQLVKRVRQLRIPVAAANVFLPGTIKIVGPEVDKEKQEAYARTCLARLKALGVKVQVLGSGGARRVPDGFSRDEAFAQLVDFCRRIAPIARENGITIVIEPLRRQETNIINTEKEGLALMRAVDRPEVRILVDYYHLSEENENPDILLESGRDLAHVHVANPKGRVYPLAADESAYAPFFGNLCKIGYAGRVSIEGSTTNFEVDGPKGLAMLRALTACGTK